MSLSRLVLRFTPARFHPLLRRHSESLRFLFVGGFCFFLTVVINYSLKLTVLSHKPVTALTIATVITMVISYFLNREWSFGTRGGRKQHYEATLFFVVSFVAIGVNNVPLYVSRYLLDLQEPTVSRAVEEIADFASGILLGTFLAMVFRLWAFRKFVFPLAGARDGGALSTTVRRRAGAGRSAMRSAAAHTPTPVPMPAPQARSPRSTARRRTDVPTS